MMKGIRWGGLALAAAAVLGPLAPAQAAGFIDPLETPAQMSKLASRSMLQGVARAGSWLVAVGQRGHILVSTDGGREWKQSAVPVSSDLTAVYFATDRKGWAVGHDGVILATDDGGVTWKLQLDGKGANERLVQSLQGPPRAGIDAGEWTRLLDEAKRYKEQGADKPFLDVWFADENTGFVVGAYNLIFRTSDGGKNWEPWFDRTDNPKFFNLYSIRPAAGGLYIAGEGGVVLKLDADGQRFRALELPYKGSFFGVTGTKSAVLVFGLRGNVFRSDDGNAWTKVDTGLPASIVGGTTTGEGAMLLADQGGRVATSADGGVTWNAVPLKTPMPLAGIADAGNGRLALVGPRGVAVVDLNAPKQ
jgi:photosystem II stability/assembly factor-like uncharacterized protein